MPRLRNALLLVPLLLLAGCFTRDVCIQVASDGSGTLEASTWVRQGLLDYTRRETGMPPEEWWFTEKALQKAAAGYGEGLRYLSHRSENTDTGKRFVVRYAFDDIRKLRVGLDPSLPFFLTPPERTRNQSLPSFVFEMPQPGLLVVLPPRVPPAPPKNPRVKVEAREVAAQKNTRHQNDLARLMRHGNPFGLSGRETSEDLAVSLGRDMRFRLWIEAEHLNPGNAQHVEEGRVVLFDFTLGTVLEDAELRRQAGEGTLHQRSWGELTRLPGVKVETGERVILQLPRDPE
jgi:hypothetical protein